MNVSCGFCVKFCLAHAIVEDDNGNYYVKMVPCETLDSCFDIGGYRRCYNACIITEPPITFVDN